MKKKSILFSLIILIFVIFSSKNIKAENNLNLEKNKVYSCDYKIGGTNSIGEGMIKKYFDSNVNVVSVSDYFLVSITLLNNKSLTNFSASVCNLDSGILEDKDGKISVYTISLEEEYLSKEIDINSYVASMNMNVNFNITLNLSNLSLTDTLFDETKEYSAVYVPKLKLDSVGDINITQNSICILPKALATFNEKETILLISAISPSGKEVSITNNSFKTQEIGTYKVTYKAVYDEYKTSLGNPSYIESTINVISSSEPSSLVKINDVNGVLPNTYYLITQRITSGSEYDKIISNLINISENYEITSVKIVDDNSNTISLTNSIEYYIETNPLYNRNEISVYLYENDKLIELDSSGYGRYVKLETDKCGTFVVLVKGVTFHMPIWGYILISISGVAILIGLVTIIILVHKRKKALYE